jgi:hypothetical protein
MTHLKLRLWLTALAVCVALAALIGGGASGHAGALTPHDAPKVLEIERYPNEPFELVDIKVGTQSVKHTLKSKPPLPGSDWWVDVVTFRENNGWFKNLTIRLRNVSGKPIYGVTANFLFSSTKEKMLYGMQLNATRPLGLQPLQPNEEVELTLRDKVLEGTIQTVQQAGLDIDSLPASVSVDSAWFSETTMWNRGSMLERDSGNPNRWIPIKRQP